MKEISIHQTKIEEEELDSSPSLQRRRFLKEELDIE